MTSKLFQPFNLAGLELPNCIVMAPLTRNRANLEDDAPTQIHCEYYAQRATAGLIISEGVQISAEGKGYFRTPGMYSTAQQKAWRRVTDAVHSANGRMYAQLWHVGRIAHTSLQPDGQQPVAPSAIAADAKTFTADGFVQCSEPRALRTDEIPRLIEDFVNSARTAKDAGFDGVELHAANGYLLDQFFREASNTRDDDYGGSVENRTRLLGEILDGLKSVWAPERIGVRFSPFSHAGGAEPGNPIETYLAAIGHAERAGVGYIHMVEGETGGPRTMSAHDLARLQGAFTGVYMANNGYDRQMAIDAVDHGTADLICFGRPYVANPDLVARLAGDCALNPIDNDTLYGGGAKGYTDYSPLPVGDDT